MAHVCLRDADLAAAAGLSADAPDRVQWMACVRCRARVAAFAEFLQPSVELSGSDWEEADARLAAILESEIHGGPTTARSPTGKTSAPGARPTSDESGGAQHNSTGGSVQRFLTWIWRPSLRPVTAVAVLVVALITVQGIRSIGEPVADPIVLRDGAAQPAGLPEPGGVRLLADGALVLSWSRVEGADRYEVVFYAEDLIERSRLGAASLDSLIVSPQVVARMSETPKDAALFWRVVAFRGGDIAAQSMIHPLRSGIR